MSDEERTRKQEDTPRTIVLPDEADQERQSSPRPFSEGDEGPIEPLLESVEDEAPVPPLPDMPPPLDVKALLEALLLVEKDGLKLRRVAHVTGLPYATIKAAMDSLLLDYRTRGGGLVILRERTGYVLATRPDLLESLREFVRIREVRLSRAAYETLAVIALNQPVTKAEIERIRGVGADAMIATLRSKNLVRVVGRKEVQGRPSLYGVGMMFFKHFGIRSLKEFRSYARRLRQLGELPPAADAEEEILSPTAAEGLGEIAIAAAEAQPVENPVPEVPPSLEDATAVLAGKDDRDEEDEWEPGDEPESFVPASDDIHL